MLICFCISIHNDPLLMLHPRVYVQGYEGLFPDVIITDLKLISTVISLISIISTVVAPPMQLISTDAH